MPSPSPSPSAPSGADGNTRRTKLARSHHACTLAAGILLGLMLLGGFPTAQGAGYPDAHLTHRFTIQRGDTVLAEEQRDVYVQAGSIALENTERWLLIRPDLQRVWLLDRNRQPITELGLDDFRTSMLGNFNALTPQQPLPAIQATGESRTIQGLRCHMYRATARVLTVEACVTRELPGLERIQGTLGPPADIPGTPIEFALIVQPLGQPSVTIRQTLIAFEARAPDPRVFTPPAMAPPAPERAPQK